MRNKFTEELKQVILDGLHNGDDEGLFGFVRDTSVDTPTAALALLRRSSPSRCLARSTTPSRSSCAENAAVEDRSAQGADIRLSRGTTHGERLSTTGIV